MPIFDQLLVLECASVLAGPAVGAFFAEFGARVIKLEPPEGDVTRHWKLASEDPENTVSAYFSSVNWGKQSLCLDLKQPAARAQAQQLAQRADLLIANYRPGAAERLGMDYATLSALNPRLIYAHLTGYGPDNPRTGYDAIVQAESGLLYLNGHPAQPPAKLPVALVDLLAAHQLKEACLLALLQRNQTGKGDYLQVSLLASALASLANQASNWLVAGHDPRPLGLEHPNIVPYGSLYTSADGQQIMLAIGADAHFVRLCQLLGCPELAQDPRFASNRARVAEREALHPLLAAAIAPWQAEPLLQALWQAGLPAGQVKSIAQALSSPEASELLLTAANGLKGLRTSVFGGQQLQPLPELIPPPPLGADTAQILEELACWR